MAGTWYLVLTAGMALGQQNNATVTQQNLGNTAMIDQTNTGGATNDASVMQISRAQSATNGNTVQLLKQYGFGNEFDIFQDGRNNLVTSIGDQGGQKNATVSPSYNGDMDFYQYGSNNEIFDFDQAGWNNQATVRQGQEGSRVSGNYVDIEAQYSKKKGTEPSNEILIEQFGNHNRVGQRDGKSGVYQKGANSLDITQNGDGNLVGKSAIGSALGFDVSGAKFNLNGAGVAQLGTGNVMDITQSGGDVVRQAFQKGHSNSLTVDQNTGLNTAASYQRGSSNTATITQGSN